MNDFAETTGALLKKLQVTPSRKLGQNFLIDPETASWIVNQLEIGEDDFVIEIGPGVGALTEHVAGRCRRLLLIEQDGRLAAYLAERFRGDPGVTVIKADAVTVDLRSFFKEQPVKVLGALPYSCATEIVRNVTRNPSPVSRAVFTLQKEVCDRLCASPGCKAFGLLSLRAQSRWSCRFHRDLAADLFLPRPKVVSGVVSLVPRNRAEFPTFDEKLFDRLARMGFSQRRKQLKKLLPECPRPWIDVAGEIGAAPACRGEELSLAQWIALTNVYDDHPLKANPQRADEIFDVVDENDVVIGRRPRGDVHAEGLRHRAVHIFVFNARGELFLQKRSHLKDAFPGVWDSSAAGHLDSGEDYLPAAVREIEEELGISATASDFRSHGKIPASKDTGWEFVELFSIAHHGKIRFPCSEIECGAWFALEEIKAWGNRRPEDFAAGFLECLELFGQGEGAH